jgi:hypothetical protein
VDTVGGDLGWSLDVVRVSRSFFALSVIQARIKSILILFITYFWFTLNHIQDPFGVLDKKNSNLYTSYSDKIPTTSTLLTCVGLHQ